MGAWGECQWCWILLDTFAFCAAQIQQVRAGPTPGSQGRVWVDTPAGRSRSRGTFQLPQPLSLPSVGWSQPRCLLGTCHPTSPAAAPVRGSSSIGQRKRLLTPGLGKKNPSWSRNLR